MRWRGKCAFALEFADGEMHGSNTNACLQNAGTRIFDHAALYERWSGSVVLD